MSTSERPREEQAYYDCEACRHEAEAASSRSAGPQYASAPGYYSYQHSHTSTSSAQAQGWPAHQVGNLTPVAYYPSPDYPPHTTFHEYSNSSASHRTSGSSGGGDGRATKATKFVDTGSTLPSPHHFSPPSPRPSPKRPAPPDDSEPLPATRRYVCPTCGFRFVRNHDLTRHIRGHNNELFKCDQCGKMYGRKDSLRRHQNGRCDGVDNFVHRPQGYASSVTPFEETSPHPPTSHSVSPYIPGKTEELEDGKPGPALPRRRVSKPQKVSHFQFGGLAAGLGQNEDNY